MTEKQLHLMRWAVRGALLLGVTVSLIANVLHAVDNPISQCFAAWPPLALLLTVELISRVPVNHVALATLRLIATFAIAGIAAWVSYWHMVAVIARYGEVGLSPYLIPFSVDGLIVVTSICLVELDGRIRLTKVDAPAPGQEPGRIEASAPTAEQPEPDPQPGEQPADQRAHQPQRTAQEIELLVRSLKATQPNLGQRKIAALAGTSPTNAGRIIREMRDDELAQLANGDTEPADLAAAAAE